MASEIEQLPDLAGFLKVASPPEWRRVSLRLPVVCDNSPRANSILRSNTLGITAEGIPSPDSFCHRDYAKSTQRRIPGAPPQPPRGRRPLRVFFVLQQGSQNQ